MKNNYKIFVVEDDDWYGKLIQYHLSQNPDHEVKVFNNGNEMLNSLSEEPDIITLDYNMPEKNGEQLLQEIKAIDPGIEVIIISGQEDLKTAVQLLKKGANDYLLKDDNTKDLLWKSVEKIKNSLSLRQEISTLKSEIIKKYDFEKTIKGESPAIKNIFKLLEKASKTNITVSITGETGTGKEVVAKAIHYNSPRKNKPFVAVNVAAIPKGLIESELFGHEKGAFTGALTRRTGKFEEAKGGTIFLDEIGEMDLNMQTKLLRVLQEREVTRIGGNNTVKIDVKIIVATHKDLQEEVRKGNFRQDLYYRLLGLPISLPPLRDRGNDILIIGMFLLNNFCKENQLGKMTLSEEAKNKLLKYPFPGNIRELKAVIELAAVMSNSETIAADDIIFNTGDSISDLIITEQTLKEYNDNIIKHFLKKYNNNVLLVAKKLDIGKSTIYRMLKQREMRA